MNKDEALKLALEALEKSIAITMTNIDIRNKAITAIKQALAAPVQEPVAILKGIDEHGPVVDWYRHWVTVPIGTKFYTTPRAAQRQWVGLTDEDFENAFQETYITGDSDLQDFAKVIEAKLKEKNT